jgi:hypothetical protein
MNRLLLPLIAGLVGLTGPARSQTNAPPPATPDTQTVASAATGTNAAPAVTPSLAGFPAPLTAERYEPLWKRSPFTLPTADTNAAAEAPAKLALLGITRLGDDTFISILNKDTQQSVFLSSREPGPYTIEAVNMAERISDSSVTLRQGTETIVVKPDSALMALPSQGVPAPAPVAVNQAVLPGQGGIPGQPPVPPALPLPGAAPGIQEGAAPGGTPPPATSRVRRRVIIPPPPPPQ